MLSSLLSSVAEKNSISMSQREDIELFGKTVSARRMYEYECPTWVISLYNNPEIAQYFNISPEGIENIRVARIRQKRREAYEKFRKEKALRELKATFRHNIKPILEWGLKIIISILLLKVLGKMINFCTLKYTEAMKYSFLNIKYTGVILKDPQTVVKVFQILAYFTAGGIALVVAFLIIQLVKGIKNMEKEIDKLR